MLLALPGKNAERPAPGHAIRQAPELPRVPTVAVLLGVKDASATVAQVIAAMKRQDYPGEWRMWIAVAPSSDETRTVVREATAGDDRFIVVDNPEGSLAHGLNLGLSASTSDVVAIVSGHCLPDDHYLTTCVDVLRRTRAGVVGGASRPRAERLLPGAIAVAHRVAFGLGGAAFRDESREGWVDTVYVGAYPRAVLAEIGPWNETLDRNQDIELNARVRRAGYGVYLSRDVVVEYRPRSTLGGLARQNYGNGYWNVRTLATVGGVLSIRHLVPGLFVASVVIGLLGAVIGALIDAPVLLRASILMTAAVVLLYVVAAVAASIAAGVRFGMRYAFVLPLVFATLHTSYGVGEVVGLVRTPFTGRAGR
jgi:glycosyltransferase involved in cell wall biosynthesis